MSDAKNIFNRTDGPLPIDGEGRILGGYEAMEFEEITPEVQKALDNGDMILLEEEEPHVEEENEDSTTTINEAGHKRTRRNSNKEG